LTAIAGSVAVATCGNAAKKAPETMRYEALLAARWDEKSNLLLMTMAHVSGFADRMPWFASAPQDDRDVLAALLTGDAAKIEAALRGIEVRQRGDQEPSSPQWLDASLGEVIEPLILVGRGDLILALHANSRARLGASASSGLAGDAALRLAMAGEWDHALRILQHEGRAHGDVEGPLYLEDLLWKLAYRHRAVATVMPVLAEIPFSAELKHLIAYRAWRLKAYQVRAGIADVVVPVIEGEQPMGYDKAAAMQIAALAQDPAAAERIANLRRVLKPRRIEMMFVDRGVAHTLETSSQAFSTAEAQIVARRKDYARAAVLARMPVTGMMPDPSAVLIEALLDEGDWRAAVEIAQEHDPRQKPARPGFDDTRVSDYQWLYQFLALGAVRNGDDTAAAALLAEAKRARGSRTEEEDWRESAYAWLDTLFAGIAEGLLPRKHLDVLTSPFSPWAIALQ
jgi:hypothetical protein